MLDEGRDLQRALYALAVSALLPEVKSVIARLVYLADAPVVLSLADEQLDESIAQARKYVAIAVDMLRGGRLAPRWLAKEEAVYDEFRLVLPADRDAYLRRKSDAFKDANKALLPLWSPPKA
jgi:hypothetical protein